MKQFLQISYKIYIYHIWLKMINKNTIKHLRYIYMPAKQVCLVQVPTLAIARRHDFQISFEFIWYMKSLESVFRFYSILHVSWGRFTAWGKSDSNDFRINTPWLVETHFSIKKAAPKVCQTFEFNLNQPQSEINLIPFKGPHHFPIFPQWLPQVPGAEDMMTIQPQIKLAIGVILTNPAPPQLLLFSSPAANQISKMVGKMPTFWASKFPAMYHHYTGDILRG